MIKKILALSKNLKIYILNLRNIIIKFLFSFIKKEKFNKISIEIYIFICVVLFFGFKAVGLGQDADWDLLNYHFYDAYAFIKDKVDSNIAPAQLQTYYNPLMGIPLYYANQFLPAKIIGFLIGAIQGINFILIYKLSTYLIKIQNKYYGILIYTLIGISGLLGAGNVSELGNIMGDNIVSIFVILSLVLTFSPYNIQINKLGSNEKKILIPKIIVSGFLIGIVVGLKLTAAIYVVGIFLSLIINLNLHKKIFKSGLIFIFFVLVGFFLVDGFWIFSMWKNFRNPFFPYFNQIFHSTYTQIGTNTDNRFLPKSFIETIFYPFYWAFDYRLVAENPFKDWRIPLVYLFSSILLIRFIFRNNLFVIRKNNLFSDEKKYFNALICFYFVSYFQWIILFGIYRYIITLELLSPLLIAAIIQVVTKNEKVFGSVLMITLLLFSTTTKPIEWGRAPWGKHYFSVSPPNLPKNSLVLITGFDAVGFMIPFFKKNITFDRIEGNLPEGTAYKNKIRQTISKAKNIFVMYPYWDHLIEMKKQSDAVLLRYNLKEEEGNCQLFTPSVGKSKWSPIRLCSVEKKNLG